jgi:protoheme IX farnesyltransferase
VMDYWRLIRPRIVAMVLFAVAISAWTAGGQPVEWTVLLHALLGPGLLISGAISLNQRIELRGDSKMGRMVGRPLPSGSLSAGQVTCFGMIASAAGMTYLVLFSVVFSQPLLAVFAAVNWVVYVLTYTPLKSRSVWQTPVGAIAGALPMLLGAAAVGAASSPMALSLFAITYFWQFPHSMAIAWLYREQFAAA